MHLPLKNESDHYIGLLENDEVADAELVDIDKAKPLSALAMDVEWGEQQLSSTSPRCAIPPDQGQHSQACRSHGARKATRPS